MGADDEGGDSSGNSGSHLQDASWAFAPRRVSSPPPRGSAEDAVSRQALLVRAADRDSLPLRNVYPSAAYKQQPQQLKPARAAAANNNMARKASKKIEHAAMKGKENASMNDLAQSAPARSDTTWKSNVDRWKEEASPRNLTPRGSSKRKTQPLEPSSASTHWQLQPRHRYDQGGRVGDSLYASENCDKSPGELSRSGIRTPQPAEEPDAESPSSVVSVEIDPLVAMASSAAPSLCPEVSYQQQPQPYQLVPMNKSPSLRTQTKRIMERAPLLRPMSSIENDPDWEFRYALESTPNLKDEFLKLSELSYPVIFTYVLEFLPGIVSMTIVGHLDSPLTKEYVDGVSLSTMFMNLTGVAFGFGLATAMDTLCSQAYGAGKPKKLGIYLQSGFIVLGITVIPVFLLNWYTEQFLLWMGQPAEVALLAGRFSRLILPGIPFLYVYELFKKLLQAQNVVFPMVVIAVLSNVVNIVLGVYLAFYTPWGYDGAAVARTIANVALPMCLIPLFMWRPEIFRQWWPGWKLTEAIEHIRAFLTLGIPGMFMMLLEWWSFEIMAAFVGLLPNSIVAISVHSVLVSVSTMAFNFFLGISVATNIRVGNYVGSNQPEHAKMASNLGMALSLAVSATLAMLIVASRNYLPEVFINDETSVALAGHALLFLMPYQMLDAVNSVMQGVFRGTGRNVLGAYINLFAYFAIGLPFGLYLAFTLQFGVEGLWMGLTAGIFGGCLVSIYKVYGTDWEEMADAARVRTS